MEKELIKIFEQLGFDQDDTAVFLSILTNGKSTVKEISTRTNIPRSTCYNIIDKLSWNGLVSSFKEGETTMYVVEDVSSIEKKLSDKKTTVSDALSQFVSMYPQLSAYENRKVNTFTDLRIYNGVDNMRKLLFKSLEESQGKEILSTCFGIINKESTLADDPEYLKEYFARMDEYKFKERAILEDCQGNREYVEECKKHSREFDYILHPRLVDTDTAHIDKYIFADSVIIFNFEKDYAIYISDPFVTKNEKILFALMWQNWEREYGNVK